MLTDTHTVKKNYYTCTPTTCTDCWLVFSAQATWKWILHDENLQFHFQSTD